MGCTGDSPSDAPPDSTLATATPSVSHTSSPSSTARRATDDGGRTVADRLDDAVVEARAKQALMRHDDLRVFSFQPEVVDGRLSLRGDVNDPDQYRQAERVVERVEGVSTVENELTIGGRPVTDARLSGDEGSAQTSDAVYHTVRSGDTLWEIARKYQASVDQLRRLNDLHSGRLRPGERLRVR